ncbi:hypothetical protein A2U01_0016785 [Trifolium medium]|uniref:Uncharacterized protein n=1 Tax=Trifolium medium TaxID=97028 RepID=A0A392N8A4_9FABA|nr:hypothetical protein [Trifolium medium]
MSHSNLDLYLKLIWTWASEHFLHVPPLSPWSFVSNAWILTPGRNILPLIYHYTPTLKSESLILLQRWFSLLMVVGITAKKPWLAVNVNHFDVGRYRRPASLTVGNENAILCLRPIWAEFGAEEEDLRF